MTKIFTSIYTDWLTAHPFFNDVQSRLSDEIQMRLDGHEPFILMLLGQSSAGKSEVIEDVLYQFKAKLTATGRLKVLRVFMPEDVDLKQLAIAIIEAILTIKYSSSTKVDPVKWAENLLETSGIMVLILDETNHQVEKYRTREAQTTANRKTADWLKMRFEKINLSIVLSGLPHTVSMFDDNEQLRNRGLRPIYLRPYDWSDGTQKKFFAAAVDNFIDRLEENQWTINIDRDDVHRGAYACGGGLIGAVFYLFEGVERFGKTTKALTFEVLKKAFDRKFDDSTRGNPFVNLKKFGDIELASIHQKILVTGLPRRQKR